MSQQDSAAAADGESGGAAPTTAAPANGVLTRMLERLFAAITSGPSLSCRPHASRQRVDFSLLARLGELGPGDALARLLGEGAEVKLVARVPAPRTAASREEEKSSADRTGDGAPAGPSGEEPEPPATPISNAAPAPEADADSGARRAWPEQQSLLSKLRIVAEEARTYEDDTGVSVLAVGFPLLSVPAGALGGGKRGTTRRVLAPVAFIPVTLTARTVANPSVDIACRNDNVDRVMPNEALMAWLEQQTGVKQAELFTDEDGADPWREIREVVAHVARALKIETPALFQEQLLPGTIPLSPSPRAEDDAGKPAIVPAAVLGLFPIANQGLLRDTQKMLGEERHTGPIDGFLRADAALTAPRDDTDPDAAAERPKRGKVFSEERLVSPADPCQARAVGLARKLAALVIHGPPGTGKSQTITNIIGDHLARGERVLFVCDKRTALDVVYNRLEHLGLASLCALIHDPQRDQKELYMAIREQLEGLAEAKTHPRAAESLKKADEELQQSHAELTRHHARLMEAPSTGAASFHELVGRWLAIPEAQTIALDARPGDIALNVLEDAAPAVRDILARAQEVQFPANPWTAAAGIGLDAFLSRPMDSLREGLRGCAQGAADADAMWDSDIPPFADQPGLAEQAAARAALADLLSAAAAEPENIRAVWVRKDAQAIARARRAIADAQASLTALREVRIDIELAMIVRERPPNAPDLARQAGALERYLPSARAWYAPVLIGRRSAAAKVLAGYGLPLSAEAADRLRGFLTLLRALLAGRALVESLSGVPMGPGLPEASEIEGAVGSHRKVLDALDRAHEDPPLRGVLPFAATALAPGADRTEPPTAAALVRGLRASSGRAQALARLEEALAKAGIFNSAWLGGQRHRGRAGDELAPILAALRAELPALEGVLRVKEDSTRLDETLRAPVAALVAASASSEQGLATLGRAALSGEITRRLAADPELRGTDARRLETLFTRVRELEARKQGLVRDAIAHTWASRQKERLVVTTGSRLNSAGAEVKRRLTVRRRRAMRLRQVLALGRGTDGGDPIMDLRPVWMASPETVAQIFPREAVFDVVVFDEASQCRLEEALPVLTRAKRIVIAGDPKQLPPTRFFETAVAASEVDEIENDQQLFEARQGEVEDLLGAALNLDVESCYLDVHYRSRNADLIGFSNTQFYSSRLQPIPAHPNHRADTAPITLYRVGGVYEKRTNPLEADEVCRIVKELLNQPNPPSIGIGCFNLAQRDLIAEKLDDAAAEDSAFARKLAIARERRGDASFEGLFVKNLENVQGDERDHIIISTAYGPDPAGRFYRRFGPLAMPGGGRRLNVLVTRARDRVHLVTSIPPEAYSALPPVPHGQTAGGGWLLFAYLSYAEMLERAYEAPNPLIPEAATAEALSNPVTVRPSRWPSPLAESLAANLAATARVGSDVYWGNDGFCVDVALHNPARPREVTVGILCDGSRYAPADDPVEWDIFRTGILEGQGWSLRRLWSPAFFRDPAGQTDSILAQASRASAPAGPPAAASS